MSRSAVILAFPLPGFTVQDRADLARWGAVSALYGWGVGGEAGPSIDTADDGREHVRISLRAVADDSVYFVSPDRGGWTVLDRHGHAATWSSLREALESICPTLWHSSTRRTVAAPGLLPA